ncbi:MAG: hypothetical protein AB2556_25360, partial [Candidatus Thiodiazotropha sp.]
MGALDYLVRDTRLLGTLVGAPQRCPLGHILTYYDGSQPQFTHLRASMLAYAYINLLSMLSRFEPDDAVRVATDSLYIRKTALHMLDRLVTPRICDCEATLMCVDCLLGEPFLPRSHRPIDRTRARRSVCPRSMQTTEPSPPRSQQKRTSRPAPRHDDPLSRHALSYLNGGGGRGKTSRAIELFRQKEPLVFTQIHRLAKEMRAREAKAQIYHSFFRWSRQTEWTPERMGQKYIPRVIIWDEVCTVPRPILETFLDWLDGRGVQ